MTEAHLKLDSIRAKAAILPGDPARIDRIAKELTDVRELAYNREFRTLEGMYQGMPVIACSTGIGGASAAIAIEELHHLGVNTMIRIGSCGALQSRIQLGDMIFASGAVRDEGTSKAYVDIRYPAVPDVELMNACIRFAKAQGWNYHIGIIHSHESFYIDTNSAEEQYWSSRGVLAADMETAALFTVGRLRGIRTASILNNVVLYGEDTSESIGDYSDGTVRTEEGEQHEILTALSALKEFAE